MAEEEQGHVDNWKALMVDDDGALAGGIFQARCLRVIESHQPVADALLAGADALDEVEAQDAHKIKEMNDVNE
jgi:hypothetical protein